MLSFILEYGPLEIKCLAAQYDDFHIRSVYNGDFSIVERRGQCTASYVKFSSDTYSIFMSLSIHRVFPQYQLNFQIP